jgi:hypothetical protein
MTDPERDHFVREIRDLQRRWRLACLALLVLLLLPVVLGGLLGVWWVPRLERERAERLEMERDRDLLQQLEQPQQDYDQRVHDARREAERQRALAEEERQKRQGPGDGKD